MGNRIDSNNVNSSTVDNWGLIAVYQFECNKIDSSNDNRSAVDNWDIIAVYQFECNKIDSSNDNSSAVDNWGIIAVYQFECNKIDSSNDNSSAVDNWGIIAVYQFDYYLFSYKAVSRNTTVFTYRMSMLVVWSFKIICNKEKKIGGGMYGKCETMTHQSVWKSSVAYLCTRM